jgi:hypothetical protein
MTMAAITPPAMVGVYGHSTYAGTAEESSAGPVVDMLDRACACACVCVCVCVCRVTVTSI